MATAAKPAIECFSFSGEAAGIAGAAALKKVRPLAECAPPGRLFSAISTLADNAGEAAAAFERAALADLHAETHASNAHLQRGIALAQRLKDSFNVDVATPLPAFARTR